MSERSTLSAAPHDGPAEDEETLVEDRRPTPAQHLDQKLAAALRGAAALVSQMQRLGRPNDRF